MVTCETTFTYCLEHDRPEDQMSRVGLVCAHCKQRLYSDPPTGPLMAFWESQPAAYTRDGEPCFVYTLIWNGFRIRSLHPAQSATDRRSERIATLQRRETRKATGND